MHFILIFNDYQGTSLNCFEIPPCPKPFITMDVFLKNITLFLIVNRLVTATSVAHHVNSARLFLLLVFDPSTTLAFSRTVWQSCSNCLPAIKCTVHNKETFLYCVLQKVALSMPHEKQKEFGNLSATSAQGFPFPHHEEKKKKNKCILHRTLKKYKENYHMKME